MLVLGANMENLAHILKIFAIVLGSNLIDDKLTSRILNILSTLRTKVPQQLQQAFESLIPEHKQKLSAAFMH